VDVMELTCICPRGAGESGGEQSIPGSGILGPGGQAETVTDCGEDSGRCEGGGYCGLLKRFRMLMETGSVLRGGISIFFCLAAAKAAGSVGALFRLAWAGSRAGIERRYSLVQADGESMLLSGRK